MPIAYRSRRGRMRGASHKGSIKAIFYRLILYFSVGEVHSSRGHSYTHESHIAVSTCAGLTRIHIQAGSMKEKNRHKTKVSPNRPHVTQLKETKALVGAQTRFTVRLPLGPNNSFNQSVLCGSVLLLLEKVKTFNFQSADYLKSLHTSYNCHKRKNAWRIQEGAGLTSTLILILYFK